MIFQEGTIEYVEATVKAQAQKFYQ